jgi:DNA-binding transcriptional LysR family regulator
LFEYNPVFRTKICDDSSKMTRPEEMTAFVRAAALGGFSAAARELAVTPSGVAKLVTRLEDRLGVRLLNRTTRKLSLTAEGAAYFERARRIVADIKDAEAELGAFRRRPKGLLRISTVEAFGTRQLIPALPRFLERYPEIQVDVEFAERRVDLVKEGIDVAIRLGALEDSSLVARKICEFERSVCAAPAYLARHGTPRRPEDLLRHNCIVISGVPELRRWPFETRQGRKVIEVSGNVNANSGEALLALAMRGVGIIRLADFLSATEVAAGRLQLILEEFHSKAPLALHAVYPQGRHRSPKVAALVDFMLESFAHAPWRRTSA